MSGRRAGRSLAAASGLLIGVASGVLPVPDLRVEASTCHGPMVITRAGSYSGCWTSSDIDTPAVRIATSAPVQLSGCRVSGPGLLVTNTVPGVKLTVRNCRFEGTYPGVLGRSGNYAVTLSDFDRADIQHSSVEQKGGFKFISWSGASGRPAVTVKYSTGTNIDGRRSDGAGGYLREKDFLQFVQLDKVRNAAGVEIAWNEIHNAPSVSAVEDNISVYQSGGTSSSPMEIHDNFIAGAYPLDPANDTYTGGGIMLGDLGGEWILARDNQVVATTNYGVAIAGGTNNTIRSNRVVASGVLPDGRPIAAMNVGVYVWNNSAPAAFGDNSAHDNASAWSKGPAQRNDWWLPDCTGKCENTHLAEGRDVTGDDEEAEFEFWLRKLQRAGITPGPQG